MTWRFKWGLNCSSSDSKNFLGVEWDSHNLFNVLASIKENLTLHNLHTDNQYVLGLSKLFDLESRIEQFLRSFIGLLCLSHNNDVIKIDAKQNFVFDQQAWFFGQISNQIDFKRSEVRNYILFWIIWVHRYFFLQCTLGLVQGSDLAAFEILEVFGTVAVSASSWICSILAWVRSAEDFLSLDLWGELQESSSLFCLGSNELVIVSSVGWNSIEGIHNPCIIHSALQVQNFAAKKCQKRRAAKNQMSLHKRHLDSCGCRGQNGGGHCRRTLHKAKAWKSSLHRLSCSKPCPWRWVWVSQLVHLIEGSIFR